MPGEGVLNAGSDFAVLCVVLLFAGQQGPSGAFAVRDDEPGVYVRAVAEDGHAFAVLGPSRSRARPSRQRCCPGTGRAAATTSLVSASMMTCTFAENR